MRVILTVPHSIAPENEGEDHLHDGAALPVAEAVRAYLSRSGVQDIHLLDADVDRTVRDYNRKEYRNSEWREELTKLLTQDCLVLDIHSYPSEGSDYSPYDGVLLTNHTDAKLVEAIQGSLSKLEITLWDCKKTDDGNGNGHNHDIVEEMNSIGVPCALVEVNEKYTGEPVVFALPLAMGVLSYLRSRDEAKTSTDVPVMGSGGIGYAASPISGMSTMGFSRG